MKEEGEGVRGEVETNKNNEHGPGQSRAGKLGQGRVEGSKDGHFELPAGNTSDCNRSISIVFRPETLHKVIVEICCCWVAFHVTISPTGKVPGVISNARTAILCMILQSIRSFICVVKLPMKPFVGCQCCCVSKRNDRWSNSPSKLCRLPIDARPFSTTPHV